MPKKPRYDETWRAWRLAALLSGMPQCCVCGKVFTLAEWEVRHEMDEDGFNKNQCAHSECWEDYKGWNE